MLTILFLFKLLQIPLEQADDFYCTSRSREDKAKGIIQNTSQYPEEITESMVPTFSTLGKMISERKAEKKKLIPVSLSYMEKKQKHYYSLLKHLGSPETIDKLLFYLYRKFLNKPVENQTGMRVLHELLQTAASDQNIFDFRMVNEYYEKKDYVICQKIRQMTQPQFTSDEALIERINGLPAYYSTPEYLQNAVRICREYYNDVPLLQYGDQIFPDTVIPASSCFEDEKRVMLKNGEPLRNAVNFPQRFRLNKNFMDYSGVIPDNPLAPIPQEALRNRITRKTIGYTRGCTTLSANNTLTDMDFSVCTFFENMETTELLNWETANVLPGELPYYREQIFREAGEGINSLLCGNYYRSMVGVQSLILFHNYLENDQYWRYNGKTGTLWAFLIQRGTYSTEKWNTYQFTGCSSFQLRGYENAPVDHIRRSFDVLASLKNEFAEEFFNICDNNGSLDRDGWKRYFSELIKTGDNIEFLGLNVSMDTLKTDMVYLIYIDDEEFCRKPFHTSRKDKSGGPCIIPVEELSVFLMGSEAEQIQSQSISGPMELFKHSRILKEKGYHMDEIIKTRLIL